MLRDHRKLHRDRLGEALIAQPGRRDDHDAAAPSAFNLRIETIPDQIGDFGRDRALLRASSAERARWDLSCEIIAETVQFL
jgi:hypothetical protein